MVLLGSFNASAFATPGHHGGIRCQTTFQSLVPTYHLAAMCIQEFLAMIDDEALQILFLAMLGIGLDA